jgi:hypothetical protein
MTTEPPADDPLDDDLEEFVRGQRSGGVHPVRIVLAVAAVLASAWVLVPTIDELAFHFRRQAAPLDIADARPDVLAKVPDGTWVKASVVLGNKAAEIPAWRSGSLRFGPITVREVVGAPLFIEFDSQTHKDLLPFSDVAVSGRLVSFAANSELGAVRQWFETRMGLSVSPTARAIVVDEKPGAMTTYLVAWIASMAVVVFSIGGIVRRLRPR